MTADPTRRFGQELSAVDLDHDAWFRAGIERAVRDADAPDAVFIDNEVVEAEWARERALLLARIGGSTPTGTATG